MNIKHTVAAVALLLLSCTSTRAQMVGSNCYLQNAWLEVGQALNGSFGPSSPPAGYHPVGGSNLAIVYDYGHDGWGVGSPAYYGDYTYPGTPFEGWSIEVNGARSDAFYTNASGTTFWNSAPGTSTLTGSNFSGTPSTAVWRGSAGASGNLRITQTTNVNPGDNWVLVTTVFRNVGTTTLTGLYYERHCDPDNDQTHSGNFVTSNNIVYQNDAVNRVLVNSMGTSYTNAYLALGTKDCRAKALIYDYWPAPQMSGLTLADIYNQTVPSTFGNYWYALGTNVTSDVAIGLIYNLGSLAPGQTTSITYAYILDGDASIDAISFPPVSGGGGTVSAGTVNCPHDFCAADPVSYVCSVSGNSGPGTWSLTGGGTDVTINPSSGALTVNPNMTTPLTVTACFTVTSGCESDRACCTFTVYPNPQFTVTGPTNACAGVPFTLGVSFTPPYTAPSHTYSWSTGATTSTMTDTKPCCASWLYTVTVTNTWGCSSQQTPAVTTFDNPPVAMMELCPTAAICVGQTTTLWAFGSGSYTSSWSATPSGIVSLSSSTLNSVVVTGTSAGTAIITYTVYNAAGCSKIATCSVTVTGGAGSITGPTAVCAGSTITLNQSTPGGTWTTSNGSIATVTPSGTNGVVTGVAPGTVIIGYSTGGSCGASVIVTVLATPTPVLPACPKDMCEGNSQFVPGDPAYNSAGYSVSWSASSPSISLSGASGAGVTITGVAAGGAILTYAVTDLSTGCTGYYYCNINIWPAPAPIGGPTDVCEGSSIALSGTPPGGTWISTNPAIGSVDPTGVVTGISGGTVTIDYILPPPMNDCYSEIVVNVIGRATACVYWGFDPACGCNAFIFTGTPGAIAYYDVYDCGGNYIFSASVTLDPAGMGVVYSWDVPDATCSLCITKVEFKGCAWPCLCPKGSTGNCCADKGKAKFAIGVTSVTETSRVHAHLEVVPNPNRGAFTLKGDISTSRDVQIEVFDVVGQSVYSAKLSMKDHNINHAILLGDNVANGVYLIKISNAEVNEVLRFALKR